MQGRSGLQKTPFFSVSHGRRYDQGELAIEAYLAGSQNLEVLKAYVRESYKRGVLE